MALDIERYVSLRVVIASGRSANTLLEAVVGECAVIDTDIDAYVTDQPFVRIIPDVIHGLPWLSVADLGTNAMLHSNAIRSPSIDFTAAGVAPGDVLVIEAGPNAASYVVRSVDGHVLIVEEELPSHAAGQVHASIFKPPDKFAYRTVSAAIDQPFFNAGQSRSACLSVAVI